MTTTLPPYFVLFPARALYFASPASSTPLEELDQFELTAVEALVTMRSDASVTQQQAWNVVENEMHVVID